MNETNTTESNLESNQNTQDNTEQTEKKEHKRKVVLSTQVKVIVKHKSTSQELDHVIVNKDIYTVMDFITSILANTKSKEEMEDILISVHSFEDTSKSEPVPEGEAPFEGPYFVANLEIEDKTIPDAMKALSSAIIPGDACIKNIEFLLEQFFLRSRLDGFVGIFTFDGVPATVPLLNSMREVQPFTLHSIYQSLLAQANNIRKWAESKFPDMKVEWDKPTEDYKSAAEKAAEERASKLVLPSGLPASKAQEGIKTPEEIRKEGPRIIHLV